MTKVENNPIFSDIIIIDEIRKLHYAENILVPLRLYELIIERQPYCISILKNDEGVIGYYAFIALEEKYYIEMTTGKLIERNLDNSEYLTMMQSENDFENKYLYILSVASKNINNHQSNNYLLLSLKSRLNYLVKTYNIKGILAHYENEKLRSISEKKFNVKNV
jgi:hypothetical protein